MKNNNKYTLKSYIYWLTTTLLLLGIVFSASTSTSYPVSAQEEIEGTPTPESIESPEATTEPEEPEQVTEDNLFIIDYTLGEFPEDQILAINDFVNSNTERLDTQYRFYTVTVQYYDEFGLLYIKMYPTEVYESLWNIPYNEEKDVIHLTISQTATGWAVSFYESQTQEIFSANTMNYSLPWTGGDVWSLTQGASGHFTTLGYSYDFSPNSNTNLDVLAIETGILEPAACYLNDAEQAMVFIKHPNGDKSGYLHLSKNSIPNNLFNKTVSKGQVIGRLYNGKSKLNPHPACTDLANYTYATPCGCGYGVHLHFEVNKLITIQNQSISSLKVNENYTSNNNNDESISPTMATFNGGLLLTYRDANGKIQTEISMDGTTWSMVPYSGGATDGKIAMVVFKDRVYQVARGLDKKIYTRSSVDGFKWSKWVQINNSGSTNENISMVVFNNRLYQAVLGEDSKVYNRSTENGDSWTSWKSNDPSGFYANGDVSMVVFMGRLYQAVRGQDNKIYTRSSVDGTNWPAWLQINQSGSTPSNITMAVFDDVLYQSVQGMSDDIYIRSTQDGINWSSWFSTDSQKTFSEVSMVSHKDRIYQTIKGVDNKIFTRNSADGTNWSDWQWINESGSTKNSITMHSYENKFFQVVYGEDDLVYLRYSIDNSDSWTNWLLSTQLMSANLYSDASLDGYILEKSEFSNAGGKINADGSTIHVGDSTFDRQYRAFLSFDTSGLPDNAVIVAAMLKFRRAGITGTNPFKTHGNLLVDIRKGGFSNNNNLQSSDFNSSASQNAALSFSNSSTNGWQSKSLGSTYFKYLNLTGSTQFRLRFKLEDNDDYSADYLKIYSGNASAANRPQLIIEYYVP